MIGALKLRIETIQTFESKKQTNASSDRLPPVCGVYGSSSAVCGVAMNLTRSRTKVVYFRVSEAEFERYMSFCRSQGVRSISDLARSGLETLVAEDRGYTLSGLTERVTALSGLIAGLSGTIQGLTEMVGNKKAAGAMEKEQ